MQALISLSKHLLLIKSVKFDLLPTHASSNKAKSIGCLAITPFEEIFGILFDIVELEGIRPGVGLRLYVLQNEEGVLKEPIISDPSAKGMRFDCTAAAAPPLDPPAVFFKLNGLEVVPNTLLNVCPPTPNSGVLVLPIITCLLYTSPSPRD